MKMIFKLLVISFMSAQIATASEFIVDTSHSNVAFSIKHLMISNVKGNFKSFDAEIDFDEKDKKFTRLVASIDTASIDTGIEKRDDHLRSPDFFDISKYPNINFEMTAGDTKSITGNLTMHGVTKKITLQNTIHGVIKDSQGNTRVGFTLEGLINRKDFGLTWNKILESGGFTVGEEVKITVDIEAIEL